MIDTWQSSVNTSKKPSEAVTRRCSVKKVFLEHRKTHVPEPPFLKLLKAQECNFIKKENLAQVFSCQFCEISKNTFSYRTSPVAASEPCIYSSQESLFSNNWLLRVLRKVHLLYALLVNGHHVLRYWFI